MSFATALEDVLGPQRARRRAEARNFEMDRVLDHLLLTDPEMSPDGEGLTLTEVVEHVRRQEWPYEGPHDMDRLDVGMALHRAEARGHVTPGQWGEGDLDECVRRWKATPR